MTDREHEDESEVDAKNGSSHGDEVEPEDDDRYSNLSFESPKEQRATARTR